MSRRPIPMFAATTAALGAAVLALAGCGGAPAETPAESTAVAIAGLPVTPTVVARLEPTATPTADPAADPWHPVQDADLADIPVPVAATRVAYEPATADLDAAAEYAMDDFDEDALVAWYKEQMTAFGWGLDSEEDGSYVFLHTVDRSDRFADKGLKRTATLLLSGSTDEAEWTLIVEAPKGTSIVSATATPSP
ncbi:MAG: hypothetical protein IPG72_02655 [Ardenticatenales bacterium]|nr:hypothetical protein [Ardenticatenales bacterium]